jgi:hypothetical protein
MAEQETKSPEPAANEQPAITFAEFLESTPPGEFRKLTDLRLLRLVNNRIVGYTLQQPDITLHCPNDICNGPRVFRHEGSDQTIGAHERSTRVYVNYVCSNCRNTEKMFSLHASVEKPPSESDARFIFEDIAGSCYKFGEYPPYGPPTPNRLLKLFGKDRSIFLKGRQCENHGLGIGAFVYYRRVVENHKNQILDEIIKVAKKVAPDMVEALEAAKQEHQFSKALESVKNAIPQALLIDGHNPLTLLHSALSEGLHAQTDEECLELAHDVRLVLAELAERLAQALKDEIELNKAISRLMQPKN